MDQIPSPELQQQVMLIDNKKPFHRKLVFILVLLLIVLLVALFIYLGKKFLDNKNRPAPSSTNPNVTIPKDPTPLQADFSGVIKEINGTTLTLSDTVLLKNGETASATTQLKKSQQISKVRITPQTKLKTEPVLIPYSLKPAMASAKTKTVFSDLTIGRTVVVVSKEKFKNLQSDQIEASSIMVSPGLTVVQGIIKDITGDNLSLQTASSSATEVRDYQFVLSSETEITPSYQVTAEHRPTSNMPRSALKKDAQIFVYTNIDINSSPNPPALKIDLIPDNQ